MQESGVMMERVRLLQIFETVLQMANSVMVRFWSQKPLRPLAQAQSLLLMTQFSSST